MSLAIFLYFWGLFSENSALCPYLSSKKYITVLELLSKNLQLYYNKANRTLNVKRGKKENRRSLWTSY